MTLLRQPNRERNPDCGICLDTTRWACRQCLRDRVGALNPGWTAGRPRASFARRVRALRLPRDSRSIRGMGRRIRRNPEG